MISAVPGTFNQVGQIVLACMNWLMVWHLGTSPLRGDSIEIEVTGRNQDRPIPLWRSGIENVRAAASN